MVLPVFDKPFRRKGTGGGASGQNPFQDFMVLGAGKSNHNPVIGFFDVLIRCPLPFLYPQHAFIIKGYGKTVTLFTRKDAEVAAVGPGAVIKIRWELKGGRCKGGILYPGKVENTDGFPFLAVCVEIP
jgi:hypothetical protein